MRNLKTITFFCILLTTISNINLHAQVTLGKVTKQIDTTFIMPAPYDSVDSQLESKQYIGLQLYLPPINSPKIGKTSFLKPFIYCEKISIIQLYSSNNSQVTYKSYYHSTPDEVKENSLSYKQIATSAYKPYHYQTIENGYKDFRFYICNSKDIGDRYYTVIDILQEKKLNRFFSDLKYSIDIFIEEQGESVKTEILESNNSCNILFMLKEDVSGDTVYCFNLNNFILVPFFVKQKALCENKYFIYTGFGSMTNKDLKTTEEVVVEEGSKWFCNEVTMLNTEDVLFYSLSNPTREDAVCNYELYYVLSDDYGHTIALNELDWFGNSHYFTDEELFLEIQRDKTIKREEILAKKQKAEKEVKNQEEIRKERKRIEIINKYGQYNGDLIAQNKVKIGFNQEMCKDAWGIPYTKSKSTTEFSVYEIWYYIGGSELHFENGFLKRIEE